MVYIVVICSSTLHKDRNMFASSYTPYITGFFVIESLVWLG